MGVNKYMGSPIEFQRLSYSQFDSRLGLNWICLMYTGELEWFTGDNLPSRQDRRVLLDVRWWRASIWDDTPSEFPWPPSRTLWRASANPSRTSPWRMPRWTPPARSPSGKSAVTWLRSLRRRRYLFNNFISISNSCHYRSVSVGTRFELVVITQRFPLFKTSGATDGLLHIECRRHVAQCRDGIPTHIVISMLRLRMSGFFLCSW